MSKRFASAACVVSVLLGAAHAAHAAIVPMTQTELLNITTNDFAGFGNGAVTSVVADGTDSVIVSGTFSSDQGGFTRFVPVDGDWQGQGTFDWSPYTSFDITVTGVTGNVGGVEFYANSGAGFSFHQGTFTSTPTGTPVTISYPISSITNPTQVQQWGFQVFSGVANAGQTGQIRLTVVPEPGALCVLGLGGILLAARRRRPRIA
jgi:hypothetical protein